jgi:hypothetical protein
MPISVGSFDLAADDFDLAADERLAMGANDHMEGARCSNRKPHIIFPGH